MDRLLRFDAAEHSSDYIDDAGFTARVMPNTNDSPPRRHRVESESTGECIEPCSNNIKTQETAMNSYHPATSRTLVGVAAAFMSVATLAVAVLAPASLDSVSRDVSVASTSTAAQPTSADAGRLTTSIDVVALRTTKLVPVVSTHTQFRRNLAS